MACLLSAETDGLDHMAGGAARRELESLAWLEVSTAVGFLAEKVPGLSVFEVSPDIIRSVSSRKTGIRPFAIRWGRNPGSAERIELPYYVMDDPFARKQASWLIAGFLHAAMRFVRTDPKRWKKISRAGGIAGFLLPKLRQAVSVNRLEPLALLIIAAGGRLGWARLKVPGIHHWTARVRHKDIDDAGWLAKARKTALAQVGSPPPKDQAIFDMAIEQAADECQKLALHLKKADANGALSAMEAALRGYLALMEGGKRPRKPARFKSAAEERVWEAMSRGDCSKDAVMQALSDQQGLVSSLIDSSGQGIQDHTKDI